MPHRVDGFGLKYTSRRSWKAERYERGRLLDVVPVAWTKNWRQDQLAREAFLEVHYKDANEMESRRKDENPFVVALAAAKDDHKDPLEFSEFRGVFEVKSTGKHAGRTGLETKVVRRLRAA